MPNPFTLLKTRLLLRFFWTPSRLAGVLARFQAVEADGVWHLERMLVRTSPECRTELFRQILEEMEHADRFSALAKAASGNPISFPQSEREELYPRSAPLWKTLAFVHVGETDATRQFSAIIRSLPAGDLRESFAAMLGDESGHVDLTEALAASQGVDPRHLKMGVYRVRLRRLREAWLRAGRSLGRRFSILLLTAIYWLLVPFWVPFARRFMGRPQGMAHRDRINGLLA